MRSGIKATNDKVGERYNHLKNVYMSEEAEMQMWLKKMDLQDHRTTIE